MLVFSALLHIETLVGVVAFVVLPIDGEPIEAVVGVLHVEDPAVVVYLLVALQDRVVRFAFDRDVCVRGPARRGYMDLKQKKQAAQTWDGRTVLSLVC